MCAYVYNPCVRQLELYAENVFTFALVWTIGGDVNEASRLTFDAFLRALAKGTPPAQYKIAEGAQVRPWIRWVPEGEATCYEFLFIPTSGTWELWANSLTTIGPLPSPPNDAGGDILVPTVDTIRYIWLLDTLVKAGKQPLFVGPTGTGKTRMLEVWLQQLPATEWTPPIAIHCSSRTSADQVRAPRLERVVLR